MLLTSLRATLPSSHPLHRLSPNRQPRTRTLPPPRFPHRDIHIAPEQHQEPQQPPHREMPEVARKHFGHVWLADTAPRSIRMPMHQHALPLGRIETFERFAADENVMHAQLRSIMIIENKEQRFGNWIDDKAKSGVAALDTRIAGEDGLDGAVDQSFLPRRDGNVKCDFALLYLVGELLVECLGVDGVSHAPERKLRRRSSSASTHARDSAELRVRPWRKSFFDCSIKASSRAVRSRGSVLSAGKLSSTSSTVGGFPASVAR